MAETQTKPARTRDEIAEKIAQESRERELAARERFDALFAEWLTKRAEYMRPGDLSDEEGWKLGQREEELARLITTIPAVYPWMILRKVEVLDHYLRGPDDGTQWMDNREVTMLGGITADLLRISTDWGRK